MGFENIDKLLQPKVVQGGAPQLEIGYSPINYRYITYKP